MKLELQKTLKHKYPKLYKDLFEKSIYQSCLGFGIEVGDGWYDIIDRASAKLEVIIEKWIADHQGDIDKWIIEQGEHAGKPEDYWPKTEQLKEKFGTIRWYHNIPGDEADQIVNDAEDESSRTCESCGQPAVLNTKGWWHVTCDDCQKKLNEQREAALQAAKKLTEKEIVK